MQEVLIIQKYNFIQFNYFMFSLPVNVVFLILATYTLWKSLISPKSRMLSRIGSRRTGGFLIGFYFFGISREMLLT